MTTHPTDLQAQATKLARRVQALPDGVYALVVVKAEGHLAWSVLNRDGGKLEGAGKGEK